MYISAPVGKTVHEMLMVQTFRPDRLLAATHNFVNTSLGSSFIQAAEQELPLADIVENEVRRLCYLDTRNRIKLLLVN